jgi:hypothetical protein
MRGVSVLACAVLASATSAAAAYEDDFRHGRVRYLDEGVTLQRATEPGAEEATTNLPFLPGDRVWSDERGRVEFQFADGSLVRLDSRSKLDYVAHDEGRGERIVLHLWSGGLMLRTRDGRHQPDFAIETPAGVVESEAGVVLRIDAEAGETRLSVYEGKASLDSGRRRVEVEAGERTYARRGETPDDPQRFDRLESDEFAEWNRDRDDRENWAGDSRSYLPEEVSPYAAELESHGDWYYESEVGHVWRPFVSAGWRPYLNGRWVWSPYGWTWVPHEPWGWAPSHYGRWGHSVALGWYWIPGASWGPGWVSWAVGGDYVGWCPLGYRDRPIVIDSRPRGRAVPRGTTPTPSTSAWVYARKADIGSRDLARRRVQIAPTEAQALRVVESPRARPSRDFQRIAEGAVPRQGALPRNVNVKPTIGDTVPELRHDPLTEIPIQSPRRRPADDRYGRKPTESKGSQEVASPRDAGGPRDANRERERSRWSSPQAQESGSASPRGVEGRRPTDSRSPSGGTGVTPRSPDGRNERARPADQDRDVLRPIFRPISEPRERSGSDVRGSAPRSEPRTAPPPRSEPQRMAPPPRSEPQRMAPPPRSESHRAAPQRSEPQHRSAPRPSAERAAPRPHKEKNN